MPASSKKIKIELYALNIEKDSLLPEVKDFDLCINWEILEHLCQVPPYVYRPKWLFPNAKISGRDSHIVC